MDDAGHLWRIDAEREAEKHRRVHAAEHPLRPDVRCPECVRMRDRHVADVLNAVPRPVIEPETGDGYEYWGAAS